MKRNLLVILILIQLVLFGCVKTPTPIQTPEPEPTPTLTPTPSPTPAPSPSQMPAKTLLPASGAGWRLIDVPTGGEVLEGAQWIEVDAPLGYKLNAAVFYPSGEGPLPVVLVLHGTGGFLLRVAKLGQVFASAGFLTVAGAWFSGSGEESATSPTPIASPYGPPFSGANLDSIKYVKALVSAAKMLPGADSRNVGLFGISRGAIAALLVASTDVVQAVVADSGSGKVAAIAIDTSPMDVVETLAAPVLILHGTADQTVPVESIRMYERTLLQWEKPYETHYYEGAPHAVTLNIGTSVDALRRAATFFDKYLTSSASSRSGSPWLGAHIVNITPELAEAMKLKPDQQGVLIMDISADGPADKAGLRSSEQIVTINGEETRVGGDIIIAINGQSIKRTNDVVAYLFGSETGQTIILTVLRQGREETIRVTVGSRPNS